MRNTFLKKLSGQISTLYIDQLIFTNKLTKKAVNSILSNSKNDVIIIIQSDHGIKSGPVIEFSKNNDLKYDNINAIYLPSKSETVFYNTMTPVNTFRLIFNKYFNMNYKQLDDKIIKQTK